MYLCLTVAFGCDRIGFGSTHGLEGDDVAMSKQLKPGQYIGEDGRTYRWALTRSGNYTNFDKDGYGGIIAPADWPAAKAALDELIAEDAEEWVEIPVNSYCTPVRISADGTIAECYGSDGWESAKNPTWVGYVAYRAGLAQGQKVRDANVRELVEAVEGLGKWPCWIACEACYNHTFLPRIKAAAEAVKL